MIDILKGASLKIWSALSKSVGETDMSDWSAPPISKTPENGANQNNNQGKNNVRGCIKMEIRENGKILNKDM